MNAGKITAKLRDAVPVHFFEDGADKAQYKNIDIPDSLKTLEIMDFGFDIAADGKITFRLHFENGILPAEFPPVREKMTRAEKAAAKAAKAEESAAEAITGADAENLAAEANDSEAEAEPAPTEAPEVPTIPEYRFNVTGEQRKALVAAISEHLGQPSKYLAAPSFAFTIGEYRIDKAGTLTGEASPELLATLAEQGFTPGGSDAA